MDFCTLSDVAVNDLELILDQVQGLADLLHAHLDLDRDNAALTAVNLIREKAVAADEIVRAGCVAAYAIRRAGGRSGAR